MDGVVVVICVTVTHGLLPVNSLTGLHGLVILPTISKTTVKHLKETLKVVLGLTVSTTSLLTTSDRVSKVVLRLIREP